jgi:hypothetical protein
MNANNVTALAQITKNPWAIAGLHTLDDLSERKTTETWTTGFAGWGSRVALAPGMVSVVTGLPGSGKTHLWAQIWQHVVAKYNLVTLVASFECLPKPHYRRYLREMFARCRDMPPELEDISGAMHWWNMPDQGFIVHRDKLWSKDGGRCFDATLYHRKARFDELGYPCALAVKLNPETRVFESVTT